MSHDNSQELALVQLVHTRETVIIRNSIQEYPIESFVMIPTKYGLDLARVLCSISHEQGISSEELVEVHRAATIIDQDLFEEYKAKENEAYIIAHQKIGEHHLEMKLVSVHYVFDEPKIVFFFTSENRVDFRDLVKDLVAVFHQRIELRQIGVRDEARIIGGLAVCGRALCCNSVSDKLQPVSIKMAKIQNLSLNSMKISGPCGRLLCCLAYEYEAYKADRRDFPPEGLHLQFEGTDYQVLEASILGRRVQVRSGDDRFFALPLAAFSQDASGHWSIIGPIPIA